MNAALVTDSAKQSARDQVAAYAAVLNEHLIGDWGEHSALNILNAAFADSAGHTIVNGRSARLALTNDDTEYVVAAPVIATAGTVTTGGAPIITVQPASITVATGSTAAFTLLVVSSGAVTYQWFKNGSALSGQTAASLVLLNAQTTDAGNYWATANNAVGAVFSGTGTLSVTSVVSSAGETGAGIGYEIP